MYLIVFLIFGAIPAYIAKSKGRNFLTWYVYGAALCIIALVHAIIIKPYDELQALQGQLRKCPYCAEYTRVEAKICKHCRNELPVLTAIQIEMDKQSAKEGLKAKNKTPVGILTIVMIALAVILLIMIFTIIFIYTVRLR